jgi:hypothetical protein
VVDLEDLVFREKGRGKARRLGNTDRKMALGVGHKMLIDGNDH